MARRTLEEQLEALTAEEKKVQEELISKKKQIQEKKKKIIARQKNEERKQRTKHLIEIGGAVYSVLGDSYQEGDVDKLIAFLKLQDQRGNYFSSAMGRNKKPDTEK